MRIDKLLETNEKANVVMYSMYITLYINDYACNSYRDVFLYRDNFDKESKKLYRALIRRINAYFEYVNKLIGDKSEYMSDIFALFDDMVEQPAKEYLNALIDLYKDIDDVLYKYFAYIEFSRSLVDISVVSNIRITENLNKIFKEEVDNLKRYRLTEIHRVSNNFADWVYRHCDTSKMDINKRQVAIEKMNQLVNAFINQEGFEKIYKKVRVND